MNQHAPVTDRESECPTGKLIITEKRFLVGMASSLARELNQRGEFAPNFYGYRCPDCHRFHLTKMAEFHGTPNWLVHHEAPQALQQWAMTGEMPTGPRGE